MGCVDYFDLAFFDEAEEDVAVHGGSGVDFLEVDDVFRLDGDLGDFLDKFLDEGWGKDVLEEGAAVEDDGMGFDHEFFSEVL